METQRREKRTAPVEIDSRIRQALGVPMNELSSRKKIEFHARRSGYLVLELLSLDISPIRNPRSRFVYKYRQRWLLLYPPAKTGTGAR